MKSLKEICPKKASFEFEHQGRFIGIDAMRGLLQICGQDYYLTEIKSIHFEDELLTITFRGD